MEQTGTQTAPRWPCSCETTWYVYAHPPPAGNCCAVGLTPLGLSQNRNQELLGRNPDSPQAGGRHCCCCLQTSHGPDWARGCTPGPHPAASSGVCGVAWSQPHPACPGGLSEVKGQGLILSAAKWGDEWAVWDVWFSVSSISGFHCFS